MLVVTPVVMCVAKPDPRPWSRGNSSGITYRVGISDGQNVLNVKCANSDVYNKISAMRNYQVTLNITQNAQDNAIIERVTVVDCQEAK